MFTLFTYLLFPCNLLTFSMSSLNPILVIRYPFIVISSPFQYHQFTFSLSSIYPFFFSFLDQSLLFLVQSLLLPCPIFTPSLLNLYSFLVQSLLLPCPIFTPSLSNLYSFLVQSLLLPCQIFTPSLYNLYSFLVQSLLLPCQSFVLFCIILVLLCSTYVL